MGFVQVGHAGADIKKGQRVSVCMEHGYVLPSADLKDCVDDPFGAECPGCERKKNERTCPVCGSREHLIKEHFIAGMRVMVCPKMKHDEWMLVRRK